MAERSVLRIKEEAFTPAMSVESSSSFEMSNAKTKSLKSKSITLDLLIKDGVLQPGKGVLSVKYLGRTCTADLLEDGRISNENGETFISPSSWAIACKKTINPMKTSGCGWGSIRYKGRSLDLYKTKWMADGVNQTENESTISGSVASYAQVLIKNPSYKQKDFINKVTVQVLEEIKQGETLPSGEDLIKSPECDPSLPKLSNMPMAIYEKSFGTQIACEGVDITVKLVIHADICYTMLTHTLSTQEEVSGYLAGTFDSIYRVGTITHAFGKADSRAQKKVQESGLQLIGWYHSHPGKTFHPSLYDVETHMSYQLQMADQPLVSIIIGSKVCETDESKLSLLAFTVSSPKLKYSEKFGSLSDRCGKPRYIEWSIQSSPEIDPSHPERSLIEKFFDEKRRKSPSTAPGNPESMIS